MIACVNVMNMQFGRAALRAKELAIRGALGATRWRLVSKCLPKSAHAMFARSSVWRGIWAVGLLVRATNALPFPLPYWVSFTIDAPVLAFTLGIALFATIISGLVPALLSARANAAEMMKEGGAAIAVASLILSRASSWSVRLR